MVWSLSAVPGWVLTFVISHLPCYFFHLAKRKRRKKKKNQNRYKLCFNSKHCYPQNDSLAQSGEKFACHLCHNTCVRISVWIVVFRSGFIEGNNTFVFVVREELNTEILFFVSWRLIVDSNRAEGYDAAAAFLIFGKLLLLASSDKQLWMSWVWHHSKISSDCRWNHGSPIKSYICLVDLNIPVVYYSDVVVPSNLGKMALKSVQKSQ